MRLVVELHLGLAEEGKLSEIQGHGTHDGGRGTSPQGADTLGPGNGHEGIDDGLVVLSVGQGLEPIALHANESQIGRVANHGGQGAGGQAGGGSVCKADLPTLSCGSCFEGCHECVEEAETSGGVYCLAQEPGRQAGVQIHDLAAGDDVSGDGERSGPGTAGAAFPGKLNPNLDHVDWLDDGGGDHAAEPAIDEGQGSSHVWSVEEVVGDGHSVGPCRGNDF